MIKTIIILLSSLVALVMTGCATSVSKISQDGKVEQVIFPEIKDAWRHDGTMPNAENLSKITPNLSKDRIYALIGSPHFDEGFGKVREWDYIFNFKNAPIANDETCQFKIIFNREMLIQETYWKPQDCSRYAVHSAPMPTVITEKVMVPVKETVTVSSLKINSDGLFEFNKSDLQDLHPGGKARLDRTLTEVLAKGELQSVKVSGYTDRLGSDEYNENLSQLRADTIKQYLVSQGVPAEKITATGLGKTDPVVTCDQTQSRTLLIDCLQANRRFEIEIATLDEASVEAASKR